MRVKGMPNLIRKSMLQRPTLNSFGVNVVLLAFILFILAQHAMVFLYHDDWGLSVLSYNREELGFRGKDFSLSHALSFSAGLYESWTGRVIPLFLLIYALKAGLWFVRIFQVAVILSVLLLSIKISRRESGARDDRAYLVLLGVTLYLALPTYVLVEGVYWFSAASCYLWGIPFFLIGAYLTCRYKQFTWVSGLLLAFAATFHEEIGVASLSYLMIFFWVNREYSKNGILSYIFKASPILLSTLMTIFAPGNFHRKETVTAFYETGFTDILLSNANHVAKYFFWPKMSNVYFALLALSLVMLCFHVWRNNKAIRKFFLLASALYVAVLSYLYISNSFLLFALLFVLAYTAALLYVTNWLESAPTVFSIYIASLASIFLVLLGPGVAQRSCVPLLMLLFVPILYSLAITNQVLSVPYKTLIIAIALLCSVINAGYVFRGYFSNYQINKLNDCQLEAARFQLEYYGERVKVIQLFKLKNPYFAGLMPYDRPLIEKWMKKYYRLPAEVEFHWR
jgi:hypothetical protein